MQLFSRKKALIAASLSALVALGACGDNVTVPPAINTPVVISITPPSATLNVGEKVAFAVQISGGSTSVVPTVSSCTSNNTAVASAALAGTTCTVTAVAAGNATITATASTGVSAAAQVTVAAPAPAITGLSLTPAAANVSVGGNVTITANPTSTPNGVTVTRTFATSSAAIASVTAAGVVTGVAPGTATITASVTGTGTGFTTTTLSGSVTVTVTALPPGVTAINVTPQAVSLIAGLSPSQTQQLTASATQPTGAAAATFTYGTTNPAVATVSATGLVTAAGPGAAVITVTATSAANASFSASTATVQVPVTVGAPAQVIINSLTDNGATIDITNVAGQFEVNLSLQPNGQVVQSVQAYVCNQGEALAACIARGPAAQQTFGTAGGQAGPIQLYINSAEFTPPNFTTGADANTLFKNGLKTIVATVTAANATSPSASNNLSQINFNNIDGLTIAWAQPTNKANDAAGITWYGGPTTPDALVPGSTSGRGSFTVVPVIYTPNRTLASVTLGFVDNTGQFVCGNNIQAMTRPFTATYGSDARSTTDGSINFFCATNAPASVAGAVSDINGYVPVVVSSVDNNNANGPANTGIIPAAATSIFTPISASAIGSPTFAGRYRQSLSYRPTTIFIPGDYRSPVFLSYDVRGGGGAGVYVDSAWANGSYSFAGGFAGNGNPLRLSVTDNNGGGNGVGLLGVGPTTSARNTQFLVCNFPTTIPTTSAYNCTSPVATGMITSTVGSVSLGENATDFTNSAYVIQVVETDRLGNRAATQPFGWANGNTGLAQAQTPGTNTAAAVPAAFGVDITAPVIVALPNSTSQAGTNPFFPNFVKTDADSIYSTLGNTYGGTNSGNAVFAVRFNDSRSGFSTCTLAGNANNSCATGIIANTGQVNAGTFAITRRTTNQTVSLTNDAVVESIITTSNSSATLTNRFLNVINANIAAGDPANREFSINIFGNPARVQSNTTLSRTPASSVAGYYTFTGTLVDRAGNTTVIPQRSVAIDNAAPQITGLQIPAILQGATTVNFVPTGTDDLEAIAGDLALTYPQIAASGLNPVTQPSSIRFRRVANFTSTALLGLWHNPFASITDNKLASPIGPGLALSSSGLNVPIPFIQQIQTVDVNDAPLAPLAITQTAMKPTAVTAYLYGIRATETSTGTPGTLYGLTDISAPLTQALFDGQITQSALPKNWGTAVASSTYQSAIGIGTWAAFDVSSPSTVEFRVTTSTSVTNPPFTRVEMIRAGATEWTHLGQATYAGILDQGGTRFWRYTFSFAGISQGQSTVAALANLDVLRAIGTDAAGNAISTNNWTVGGNANSVTSISVTPSSVFVPTVGGTYPLTPTVVSPSGAIAPSITYAVTANSGFTISVNASGVVTVAGGFTPGATATVTVTATGVGSTGFNGNTVSANVTFTSGVAGISAVSVGGTIPSTLTPGQFFTLTATPTQPTGAPTPTYSWSAIAGFTLTQSGNSATYTYTGATPINGASVTATVTASTVQNAPGFSAASVSGSTTNGAVNGFQNGDSFALAVSVPQATINAGSAYQSTITNTNPNALAISTSCAVNSPIGPFTFATVSNTALISAIGTLGVGFTASTPVGVTCTTSRAQQTVGGVNYAARTVSTNVSTVILPFGTQSVTLSPSGPSTVAQLQTLVVNASATTSTGASAVTFLIGNGANGGAAATGACTYAISGSTVTVTAPGATATCTYTVVGTTTSTAYTGTAGTGTVGNAVSSAVYTVNVP